MSASACTMRSGSGAYWRFQTKSASAGRPSGSGNSLPTRTAISPGATGSLNARRIQSFVRSEGASTTRTSTGRPSCVTDTLGGTFVASGPKRRRFADRSIVGNRSSRVRLSAAVQASCGVRIASTSSGFADARSSSAGSGTSGTTAGRSGGSGAGCLGPEAQSAPSAPTASPAAKAGRKRRTEFDFGLASSFMEGDSLGLSGTMERAPRDPRVAPWLSRPRRRIAKRAARRKAQEALYHPRPAKSIANSNREKSKETTEKRATLRAPRPLC